MDEKPIKKQWSLKRPKVGPQGESPHSTLFTLRLNFDEDDGAPSGKKGMELPKEGHHLKGGGGLKV